MPIMIAYCLADLFNLGLWPSGRRPSYADVRDGISDLLGQVVGSLPSASEITIRLYGGWHRRASDPPVDTRLMVARAIDQAPKRQATHRLRLQLADRPVSTPAPLMLGTLRTSSLRRVPTDVTPSTDCAHSDDCTLSAFRSWASGSCPRSACAVRLRDVAEQHRQKMVDTLLTADAMTIAHRRMAHAIVIASDDDDMVPALLALVPTRVQVACLRRSRPHLRHPSSSYYPDILNAEGVTMRHW
ncbi:MAG: NYN domain-containing protein [Gemmatimonadetes bacterium]|nr:NYN domain-containing protein [Gemmatimonadota bacterium]MYB97072.1 NYN domain-containing protein [Gemmatimonadota bacterium]